MEIRYPNYYKKFHCVAGACPDTCCAGWEIRVDAASERRYREAQKSGATQSREFARKLKKYVKHGQIISDREICPFLNREGLCEMYIELGPDSLCHTCARHPRHLEDYGNLHEMVLLLSCPEAARLILSENEGGFYVRKISARQGNMDGIDAELLEILLMTRELIWKWNSDAALNVDETMAFSVALAHDLQKRIRAGEGKQEYAEAQAVLERYKEPGAIKKFLIQWKQGKQNSSGTERFSLMSEFISELSELETICRDWPEILETCRSNLCYSKGSQEAYADKRETLTAKFREFEQDKQKLFEYFVYSFVLSALYDGDLLTKMKMAVLCTMAVEELYVTEMMKAEVSDTLDIQRRAYICHAIARQIENSDGNREQFERFLKQERFGARRIINALIL